MNESGRRSIPSQPSSTSFSPASSTISSSPSIYLTVPGQTLPSSSRSPTPQLARTSSASRVPLDLQSESDTAENKAGTKKGIPGERHTKPSEFDIPPPRTYLSGIDVMSSYVSQYEIDQYIQSLNSHRVNTIVELRRIEKVFAQISGPGAEKVTQPMTAAWMYYVNSHALLSELRRLTRNYPFSAECIEEAKRRVYSDPESNRSWNFCWLVLNKIQNDQLISIYAHTQASEPTMWGNRTPTVEGVGQLSGAFVNEWTWALSQMLRHWDQPPRR